MYHDKTAWRCAFFVGKYMEAKAIHKEILAIGIQQQDVNLTIQLHLAPKLGMDGAVPPISRMPSW
jgi:hypothetical protein